MSKPTEQTKSPAVVAGASTKGDIMEPIWNKENGEVRCWVEARPTERGGRFRVLVTTPAKSKPGNGFPYEQEADAIQAAGQTFKAFDAIYNGKND